MLFTIYKNSRVFTWNPTEYNILFVLVENFREHWNIWEGSPVFPDGMFQLGIGVPLNPALIPVFQVFAAMFWLKELIHANGTNVNTLPKNEIYHESWILFTICQNRGLIM